MSTRNNPINFSIIFFFKIIIIITIPSSFSQSFNLSTIGPDDQGRSINITGHATITSQGILVTPNELNPTRDPRAGRATYMEPLHLWDRASRNLTDFTTHFSFVIDSRGYYPYADGLAFFLAPIGSRIQSWSYGGNLGLGNGRVSLNSSAYSFVAVEFDTFWNDFDPPMAREHVGIDINSMESVHTAPWHSNFTGGDQNDAWISYNATSMMLSVVFTQGSTTTVASLSYKVDLRDELPEYVTFGFSASTHTHFERHIVTSWQFFTNLERIVAPQETTTPPPLPLSPHSPFPPPPPLPESKTRLIVGLSVGLPVSISGVVIASYCLWKKKYTKEEDPFYPDMDMEFEKGSGAKRFSYKELVLATKDFAEEEKLGEGGFGGVYRGLLRDTGSYIAVKRVSRGSKQGLKEYASEVKIISRLRHRNLVQLLGWCHQRGELLLVYEFMPNGSLDSHLFKSKSILTWEVRYNIVQGLASALLYLHKDWEHCVVHRDIKSSNIMLDSSFTTKLGDFGLARIVDHEKGAQTTVLAGTIGYMAPECAATGRASKETDVYSFGVVLLEICCGRRPIDRRYQEENQVVLVEWVWSLYGMGKLVEAADPNLSTGFDERGMEQVMVVGLWCVHPDPNHRPTIKQASQALNFEVPLPILPRALPLPMYKIPIPTICIKLDSNKYSSSSTLTGR